MLRNRLAGLFFVNYSNGKHTTSCAKLGQGGNNKKGVKKLKLYISFSIFILKRTNKRNFTLNDPYVLQIKNLNGLRSGA